MLSKSLIAARGTHQLTFTCSESKTETLKKGVK